MTDATPTAELGLPALERTRSIVSKRWLVKMVIMALAALGFGLWGLYDATIKYPNRGIRAAEFLEFQYLQALSSAGRLSQANIEDPRAALNDLSTRLSQRVDKEKDDLSPADRAKFNWLEQLDFVNKLEPAENSTRIPRTDFRISDSGQPIKVSDFNQRFNDLQKRWTKDDGTNKAASPLGSFDLPSQWIIFALGTVGGLYVLALIAMVKSKTYRWDNAEKRLTLPNGHSFIPSDLEDVDKRKWHRLYVTVKVKPDHPQLGGQSITFDLMRYEPVEEWYLEMERIQFPDLSEPPADAGADSSQIPAPAATSAET